MRVIVKIFQIESRHPEISVEVKKTISPMAHQLNKRVTLVIQFDGRDQGLETFRDNVTKLLVTDGTRQHR